ncbi:hypothetical protein ACHAWT_001175 [Skeletonema menzelii]
MSETLPLLHNNGSTADDDATSPPRYIGGGGGIIVNTPLQIESPTPTIDTGSDRHRRSSVIAIAAAEAIRQDRKKSRTLYAQQDYESFREHPFRIPSLTSIGSLEADVAAQERLADERNKTKQENTVDECHSVPGIIQFVISQIPAVIIAAGLNFMVGIPFGASYFPTELQLQGKEVLGFRMFLFATMIAQLVFTFASKFDNGIGLQMVENVPFCLELARIVMSEQSDESGTTSTLFFLFGFSSVLVGLVFYLLGRLEMGRIVYFFPSHVLVGCIGGIGVFIAITAIEVSTNTTFSFTPQGLNDSIVSPFNLLLPVFAFEIALRLIVHATKGQYSLLPPVFYCLITPVFYLSLYAFGVGIDVAEDAGYFFPPIKSTGSAMSWSLLDIFTEIHISKISWKAVIKAIPTMISLTAFSLIHVPINIPAFAISTNTEPDMNAEMIAHGFSNFISGMVGGLQNYMTYSNSVIYSKSNGRGKCSSLAIVALTGFIFIYGPLLCVYVPRCMAGTLLLHVGIDLFLEGVVESYHDYDSLEYSGIILITITMTILGMDAALIAGFIAALSTYAVQSITYQHPIKGSMCAATLRSSAWNRSAEAQAILLDKKKGRERILVIECQGHIFFGNSTILKESVLEILTEKRRSGDDPIVVILDFTYVLAIDSSSAMTIEKLKDLIIKKFGVEVVVFVCGHEDGFRCHYDLSLKVNGDATKKRSTNKRLVDPIDVGEDDPIIFETCKEPTRAQARASVTARALDVSNGHSGYKNAVVADIPNSHVCETLDDALIFSEDVLVAVQDAMILQKDVDDRFRSNILEGSGMSVQCSKTQQSSLEEIARAFLTSLCTGANANEIDKLYQLLEPEKYYCNDVIWTQGDESESLKLIVDGSLLSLLESEDGARESCYPGSIVGELGLLNGTRRLTTLKVVSDEAVLYSLCKEKWEVLTREDPKVARFIDVIAIRYLSHRIQHVSNHNLFGKRSLPV